jgi:hypothetical protein
MWAMALATSPCDRTVIRNRRVDLSLARLTFIVWQTGYGVVA